MNAPEAPAFSPYSKPDAVWAKRVDSASSLRQQRHLLYAKEIRATEALATGPDGVKRKAMDFGEEIGEHAVDALDKVRMFLESQNTLGAIAEGEERKLKKPKRRSTSGSTRKLYPDNQTRTSRTLVPTASAPSTG